MSSAALFALVFAAAPSPTAAQATSVKALHLTRQEKASLSTWAERMSAAEKAPPIPDEAACALLADFNTWSESLAEHLQTTWEKVQSTPAGEGDFDDGLNGLHTAVPTLRFGVGEMGGEVSVDVGEWAKLPLSAGFKGLIRLLPEFEPLAFYTMWTDSQGCNTLRGASEKLDRLTAAWNGAPACLKPVLNKHFTQALDGLNTPMCVCGPADEERSYLPEVVTRLKQLPDFDGAHRAASLKAALKQKKVEFGCKLKD